MPFMDVAKVAKVGLAEIAAKTDIRFLLDNMHGRVLDIKANNRPIGQISDLYQHNLDRVDLIRLVTFDKTNGVAGERGGVKTYTLYFRAELEVIETFLYCWQALIGGA